MVIRVRDEKGQPVKAVAVVDTVQLKGAPAERTLGGVPVGTHTVIVGAEGFVGALRHLTWKGAETLTAAFTLTRR